MNAAPLADASLSTSIQPPCSLDDAVGDREPEAGALAHVLGGEEGLEDVGAGTSAGMPAPWSSTAQTHAAGLRAAVLGRRRAPLVRQATSTVAALRHRLDRVHDQVGERLLDLPRVGLDQTALGRGVEPRASTPRFCGERLEQRERLAARPAADRMARLLGAAAAREVEELADDLGHPLRLLAR